VRDDCIKFRPLGLIGCVAAVLFLFPPSWVRGWGWGEVIRMRRDMAFVSVCTCAGMIFRNVCVCTEMILVSVCSVILVSVCTCAGMKRVIVWICAGIWYMWAFAHVQIWYLWAFAYVQVRYLWASAHVQVWYMWAFSLFSEKRHKKISMWYLWAFEHAKRLYFCLCLCADVAIMSVFSLAFVSWAVDYRCATSSLALQHGSLYKSHAVCSFNTPERSAIDT
jgi:hypothetical protein